MNRPDSKACVEALVQKPSSGFFVLSRGASSERTCAGTGNLVPMGGYWASTAQALKMLDYFLATERGS